VFHYFDDVIGFDFCISELNKKKIAVAVNETFPVYFFLYRWTDTVSKVLHGLFRTIFPGHSQQVPLSNKQRAPPLAVHPLRQKL